MIDIDPNKYTAYPDRQILTSTFENIWYWHYESYFWPEQIMRIKEICESKEEEEAFTSGADPKNPDRMIRNNKVSWHDEEELYSLLRPVLHETNQNSGWNYNITAIEPLQYTVYYGEGENHYSWHTDTIINDDNMREDAPDGPLKGTIRKLSMVIQLSSPDEYEGGDFELLTGKNRSYLEKGEDAFELEPIKINSFKDKGSVLIFPSYTFHRVKPVTKGIRKSLVCWFRGPKWQ